MTSIAVAEQEPHRPDWADCVVLVCTRCKVRTKVSWEVFEVAARGIYEAGDMPERILWWHCGGRDSCHREGAHFVDLDTRFLVRAPDRVSQLRGARVCGCRECTRR